RKAAARSSRGVVMRPPPPGKGRRRYYRTIRPLLEGVTPWVAGRTPRARDGAVVRAGRGARGAAAHQSRQEGPGSGRGSAAAGGVVVPGRARLGEVAQGAGVAGGLLLGQTGLDAEGGQAGAVAEEEEGPGVA